MDFLQESAISSQVDSGVSCEHLHFFYCVSPDWQLDFFYERKLLDSPQCRVFLRAYWGWDSYEIMFILSISPTICIPIETKVAFAFANTAFAFAGFSNRAASSHTSCKAKQSMLEDAYTIPFHASIFFCCDLRPETWQGSIKPTVISSDSSSL